MCGSRQGLRAARYKEGRAGARRHPPPAPPGAARDRRFPPAGPRHRPGSACACRRLCLRRGGERGRGEGGGKGEVLAPEEDCWSPLRCAEPSEGGAVWVAAPWQQGKCGADGWGGGEEVRGREVWERGGRGGGGRMRGRKGNGRPPRRVGSHRVGGAVRSPLSARPPPRSPPQPPPGPPRSLLPDPKTRTPPAERYPGVGHQTVEGRAGGTRRGRDAAFPPGPPLGPGRGGLRGRLRSPNLVPVRRGGRGGASRSPDVVPRGGSPAGTGL